MRLLFKSQGFIEGYTSIVTPQNSPLKHISFGRLQLRQGEQYEGATGESEVVLDILAGLCDMEVTFEGQTLTYPSLGGRADVFDGNPTLLCLPPGATYEIMAISSLLDIAVSAAPAPPGKGPTLIKPEEGKMRLVGAGNWERIVRLGTVGKGGTRRLMVGETVNRPGCWSSFPPHKHDEDKPGKEVAMEEVYFYVIRPRYGFGVQCLYDPPDVPDRLEEAFIVHDGDTVIFPRGYHPVVAAPGYRLCYVWVLHAEEEAYGSEAWTYDPDHAWLRDVEAMLKWPPFQ